MLLTAMKLVCCLLQCLSPLCYTTCSLLSLSQEHVSKVANMDHTPRLLEVVLNTTIFPTSSPKDAKRRRSSPCDFGHVVVYVCTLGGMNMRGMLSDSIRWIKSGWICPRQSQKPLPGWSSQRDLEVFFLWMLSRKKVSPLSLHTKLFRRAGN